MASKSREYYLNNPNLPTSTAEYEYTPQMVRDLKKCAQNLLFFAENYFYIIDPDKGRVIIELYKYQKDALRMLRDNRYNILLTSRQLGKALALDTPIPTPTGWTTMGELKAGDKVYGLDGKTCNVTMAHDILYNRKCFKLTFDNGETIIADADHLWFTQAKNERGKIAGSIKTTQEIFNTQTKWNEPNHRIPMCIAGIDCEEKMLPIDPYVLGLWLGDGASSGGYITVGKRDLEDIVKILNADQAQFDKLTVNEYNTDVFSLRISSNDSPHTKSLTSILKKENLTDNKHIPAVYMRSSRSQRLRLLMGLVDSDGYIMSDGTCQFYNTNLELVDQVKELVESLGYKVTTKQYTPTLDGVKCSECKSITFKPIEYVCNLPFKKQRIKCKPQVVQSKYRSQWHYIKSVEVTESVPVRCITVDSPDSLYLCGKQYIPTHNTTLLCIYALWVACFNQDQNILIVANKESTAIEIFRRVRLAYEQLPNWLKPGVQEYGKTSMTLDNGSRVGISTTTGSAARGQSLNVLLLDELAFIDPPSIMEDFWRSVWPTISRSKTSKVLIASTPNGTDNLFYQLYDGAIKGQNDFSTMTIKWDAVPGRDEKWKQSQIKQIGSIEAFLQEYECVFHHKGESSIDIETFEKLKQYCSDPEIMLDGESYKIWKSPEEDRIYVAGVDVAEGVGQNYSVVQILDITDLTSIEQVAIYRDNAIAPAQFTVKLNEIMTQWGKPLVLIERNSCGQIVVENLRANHNYENIVSYGAELAGRKKEFLGVIAHTNTKQRGVLNMRYWVNVLKCVKFNDINTLLELKDFVRKPNGTWSARGNGTDDCVMALVWALVILDNDKQFGICNQYFEVEEMDDNGKPSKLKPIDFGLTYFTKKDRRINSPGAWLEMMTAEQYKDSATLPIAFGSTTSKDDDLADLELQGWKFL
jgi:hypothetical protein